MAKIMPPRLLTAAPRMVCHTRPVCGMAEGGRLRQVTLSVQSHSAVLAALLGIFRRAATLAHNQLLVETAEPATPMVLCRAAAAAVEITLGAAVPVLAVWSASRLINRRTLCALLKLKTALW